MYRLLFEKKGDSVWMSHLDLMRVFQRAFRRAGLHLKHSQGFNPRAIVSIALPLSVGMESCCELLDFELDGDVIAPEAIADCLNLRLPDGISVLRSYIANRKVKDIADMTASMTWEYDTGVPIGACNEIRELFLRETLILKKHSRKGEIETDILPLLKEFRINLCSEHMLEMQVRVAAQNPSLNPQLLVHAVELYLPHLKPDYARYVRLEVLDSEGKIFR